MDGWFTRFLNESGNWAPRFEPSFRPFAEDEEDASAILIAEHSVMPGLLQTSTYARTLLAAHPGVSEADVENGVAGRMTRQVILDRENPPALWVVLDEMALHREVGGPEIMAAQLRHLARIARRPHVTVQVLTTRAHPGVQGAINIVEKTGVPAVAYMEDFADGRIVDDRATVAGLLDRFRHLQSSALPAVASLELIERLVEQRCAQEQDPDGGSAPTAAALPPHAWKSASPAT